MALSLAARRYYFRFFGAMMLYLVSLFAAKYLARHDMVDGLVLWVLAALPGLAIIGAIWAIAMRVLELEDEYLRVLMVRQLLVATGLTLSFCAVWGFLENFGLVMHVELYWVAVIWLLSLSAGALFNRITEGAWGACL